MSHKDNNIQGYCNNKSIQPSAGNVADQIPALYSPHSKNSAACAPEEIAHIRSLEILPHKAANIQDVLLRKLYSPEVHAGSGDEDSTAPGQILPSDRDLSNRFLHQE